MGVGSVGPVVVSVLVLLVAALFSEGCSEATRVVGVRLDERVVD